MGNSSSSNQEDIVVDENILQKIKQSGIPPDENRDGGGKQNGNPDRSQSKMRGLDHKVVQEPLTNKPGPSHQPQAQTNTFSSTPQRTKTPVSSLPKDPKDGGSIQEKPSKNEGDGQTWTRIGSKEDLISDCTSNLTQNVWDEIQEILDKVYPLQIKDFQAWEEIKEEAENEICYLMLNTGKEIKFYYGQVTKDDNSVSVPNGLGYYYLFNTEKPDSKHLDPIYFEGYFKDGELAPNHARIIFSNKNRYEGAHSNNLPNGKGIMTDSNGATTTCDQWNNGVENGKTTKTDQYGRKIVEGQMASGKLEGDGFKLMYVDKEYAYYLEGYFFSNLLEGQGKKTYKNNCSYHGNFLKEVETGYGKFSFEDGRTWEGKFDNGQAVGKGRLTKIDGNTVQASCDIVNTRLPKMEKINQQEAKHQENQTQHGKPQEIEKFDKANEYNQADEPQVQY
jgi:hypothetical protein